METLTRFNSAWIAGLFLAVYVLFIMPAIVVIPVVLLIPFIIRYDNSSDECLEKFTKDACEIYRESSAVCEKLDEVLENDIEWKKYRYAVCKGLENASPDRLIQSYSEELFPDCDTETTVIQGKIEGFSRDDCKGDDNIPAKEEKRVSPYGFQASPVFLFFGVIGLFFSVAFIYSGSGGVEIEA